MQTASSFGPMEYGLDSGIYAFMGDAGPEGYKAFEKFTFRRLGLPTAEAGSIAKFVPLYFNSYYRNSSLEGLVQSPNGHGKNPNIANEMRIFSASDDFFRNLLHAITSLDWAYDQRPISEQPVEQFLKEYADLLNSGREAEFSEHLENASVSYKTLLKKHGSFSGLVAKSSKLRSAGKIKT